MFSEVIVEAVDKLLGKIQIPEWVYFGGKGVSVAIGCVLVGFFFPSQRSFAGAILLADAAFFWGYYMRAF